MNLTLTILGIDDSMLIMHTKNTLNTQEYIPYIMDSNNSQSVQAEECDVSKLSAIEAQEEVQFALNELTSHEYSDEEYMKWEEKLCKKAMKIDKTGKINFTPEAWFNWLVKEGLTNDDILNDLAREYGNWNGRGVVN